MIHLIIVVGLDSLIGTLVNRIMGVVGRITQLLMQNFGKDQTESGLGTMFLKTAVIISFVSLRRTIDNILHSV